ncbi:alpha/beta hydrolase [Cohnella sp.]|uniref:alpha/beta hydrolase n=1 Tax=Cohnella sp. TaxID=1883426 RepID=UPI0035630384
MNLEYIKLSKSERLSIWLRQRLSGTFALDTWLWRYAVITLWLVSCSAVAISAMGMPTGFGTLFDIVTGLALNTIAMALFSGGAAALLTIVGLRIPRFTAGSLLYVGVLAYFIFYFSEFGMIGSVIFCVLLVLFALAIGLVIGLIAGNWGRRYVKIMSVVLAGGVVLSIIYTWSGASLSISGLSNSDTVSVNQSDQGDVAVLAANLSDPSVAGSYLFNSYTYGSGQDRHRHEYGAQTDFVSQSVDASTYINDWPWLRSKFWGFDETELPLNGRVWMPEGEGPFPLVLMVHGNHLMEKFSDEGYGYLGELLASRGIAAISIDENFLNYSVWTGIPDEDMKVRAWLLLKHIQQIQDFAQQEGSLFYDKINFQQLALLGHSRGGQAAVMAADRDRCFKGDDGLPETVSYAVQAIIALAPTDTTVDKKQTQLKGISYLTLQGAKDSDLVNFYGDRQYWRTAVSGDANAFKASLYIEDANHSQFNTEWGQSDQAFPAGLFIRPKAVLESKQQRQIAKVYVTAFLETIFHDYESYGRLFRDYRTGLDFLPATRYFSQYENGSYRRIADFEGGNRADLSPGVIAEAVDLTDWRHVEAFDREGKGKGNKGVVLEWADNGSYTINLSPSLVTGIGQEDIMVFSMANLEHEQTEEQADAGLWIDIEVEDRSGTAIRLPLKPFMEEGPPAATDFTWLPGMESVLSEGKYKDSDETVFQTYELPLGSFHAENSRFNPSQWSKLTFYFAGGPGKIMIGDAGIMPE